MRGKLRRHEQPGFEPRNIPAYAGKTSPKTIPMVDTMEHPRVCGENVLHVHVSTPTTGTSPRMRGKPARHQADKRVHRNIPAYAGKTSYRNLPTPPRREHPRVCGENGACCGAGPAGGGTSPRMRGKPALIIVGRRNTKEHPRVCGENTLMSVLSKQGRGTSPRMRGKHMHAAIH